MAERIGSRVGTVRRGRALLRGLARALRGEGL